MARRIEYFVVLDANILVRDFWTSGLGFAYLDTHRFLGHLPVVPEVAFMEARNQLKRRAEELISHHGERGRASAGNQARLMRLFNCSRVPKGGKWNIERMVSRWERHVLALLSRHGGKLLPTPNVALDEIAQRSVERRKPFSGGDRGFRDTLVWLSALELVGPNTRVSFISNNTQDFFAEGVSSPHPAIASEATEKSKGSWRMLFHRSLDDFIAHFDSDREASAEALQRALLARSFSGFDMWEWLETNLPRLFVGGDELDDVHWAGLSREVEAPFLVEMEEIVGLNMPYVRHVAEDTYRVYGDVAFIANFRGSIELLSAREVVHPQQLLSKNESDPFWTEVRLRSVGTLAVGIDIDVKRQIVTSFRAYPLQQWEDYDDVVKAIDNTDGQTRFDPPLSDPAKSEI